MAFFWTRLAVKYTHSPDTRVGKFFSGIFDARAIGRVAALRLSRLTRGTETALPGADSETRSSCKKEV